MTWVAVAVAAVGVGASLYGQNQAKKAGKADAAFTAEQLRQRAEVSKATGQRMASEENRQARLVESALQARAGGGGLDVGNVKLAKDIAGEGEYRALSALYSGDTSALGDEASASAVLRSQEARSRAANYAMAGTVLSSASSMYGRYGGGGDGGLSSKYALGPNAGPQQP